MKYRLGFSLSLKNSFSLDLYTLIIYLYITIIQAYLCNESNTINGDYEFLLIDIHI